MHGTGEKNNIFHGKIWDDSNWTNHLKSGCFRSQDVFLLFEMFLVRTFVARGGWRVPIVPEFSTVARHHINPSWGKQPVAPLSGGCFLGKKVGAKTGEQRGSCNISWKDGFQFAPLEVEVTRWKVYQMCLNYPHVKLWGGTTFVEDFDFKSEKSGKVQGLEPGYLQ